MKLIYDLWDKPEEFFILFSTQFTTGASKTPRNHLWIFNPCIDLLLNLADGVWEKPFLSSSDIQSHEAAYRQDEDSICGGLMTDN